jgi:hypothetical protein
MNKKQTTHELKRGKNYAVLFLLSLMVILFFIATIVKLSAA